MAVWSGQITVATAGTAVAGPDVVGQAFLFTPHPSNAGGFVWIGNDGEGDIDTGSGFPLSADQVTGIEAAAPNAGINLSLLRFDVTTSGDKICWLRIR